MRYLLTAAFIVTAIEMPSRADACSVPPQNLFAQFDQAATVASIRVLNVNIPAPVNKHGYRPGMVTTTLEVQQMLKGPSVGQLVARSTLLKCDAHFQIDEMGFVFLRRDGRPLGASYGFRRTVSGWQTPLEAWAKANTPSARAAVLVDALTGGLGPLAADQYSLAGDAAQYLLHVRPKLLKQIDAAQRARLERFAKSEGEVADPARRVLRRLPRP